MKLLFIIYLSYLKEGIKNSLTISIKHNHLKLELGINQYRTLNRRNNNIKKKWTILTCFC